MLLRLAFKNLFRHTRRTVLTSVAIIAGIGVFIVGEGFISGVEENIVVSAINNSVGHVTARPRDYPTVGLQHPVDALLTVTPEARALLDEEAEAWTERTYFVATAASGADHLRVRGIAYDPERDEAVFPRHAWGWTSGALPDPGAAEVAVSAGVARLLDLATGDRLVLQTRTHQGAINALEAQVTGVLRTFNTSFDLNGVFVPATLASDLLATDDSSHVMVRLSRRGRAGDFASRLRAALGEQAETVTWVTETAELLRLQGIRRNALNIVVLILMALAAFGMANTILMAAYERVREVGTLRAMGLTESGVVALFLAEGAVMGLIGSALGAAWGGALVWHWSVNPIDFSQLMEQEIGQGLSVSALIYTAFQPGIILGSVFGGAVVATVASIYPARVASRMAPADAVRAE